MQTKFSKALRKAKQRIYAKCRKIERKRRAQYSERVEAGIYRAPR